MIAVIFEAEPQPGKSGAYFDAAAALRPLVEQVDGFISIERFESVSQPGRFLSLSFWRDAAAIKHWREFPAHRHAQKAGQTEIFASYRLRVAQVVRDYGSQGRAQPSGDRAENLSGFPRTTCVLDP
jgi:heme-degrading monooxygenase HmoA